MVVELELTNSTERILVSKEDVDKVKGITWYLDSYGYAISNKNIGPGRNIKRSLHRLIINAKEGQIVDHIDRDKLNNTTENLRFATPSENTINTGLTSRNTTGYKGVSIGQGRYVASIVVNGESKFLGSYSNPEDAAKAYNIKAVEYFGEYAWLNDVDYRGFTLSSPRTYSSKYKGVSLNKVNQKWRARLTVKGKERLIGNFDTEYEAAIACDEFAYNVLGEQVHINIKRETIE